MKPEEQNSAAFYAWAMRNSAAFVKHSLAAHDLPGAAAIEEGRRIGAVWLARFRNYNRLYGGMHQ